MTIETFTRGNVSYDIYRSGEALKPGFWAMFDSRGGRPHITDDEADYLQSYWLRIGGTGGTEYKQEDYDEGDYEVLDTYKTRSDLTVTEETVLIQQFLDLVDDDTLAITYTVTNNSGSEKIVGFRPRIDWYLYDYDEVAPKANDLGDYFLYEIEWGQGSVSYFGCYAISAGSPTGDKAYLLSMNPLPDNVQWVYYFHGIDGEGGYDYHIDVDSPFSLDGGSGVLFYYERTLQDAESFTVSYRISLNPPSSEYLFDRYVH